MGFNPEDEKAFGDTRILDDIPDMPETMQETTLPNSVLDIDQYMNDEQPVTDAPIYSMDDLGLNKNGASAPNGFDDIVVESEVDETLMDLEQYRKHYRNNKAAAGNSNTRTSAPRNNGGNNGNVPPKKRRKKRNYVLPLFAILIIILAGLVTLYFAKSLKDQIVDSRPSGSSQSSTLSTASSTEEKEAEKEDEDKGEIYYITGCKEDGKESVYEKPDKKSPVVAELKNGDEIRAKVEDPESNYMKVYLEGEGMTGYVRKTRLVSNPAFVADLKTYYVDVEENEKVALLEGVSAGSEKIGSLTTNQKVSLIAKASVKYWYVYSKDLEKYGYIDKDLIKAEKVKTEAEIEKEKAEEKAKKEEEAKKKAEEEKKKEQTQQQAQQQTQQTVTYSTYYVSGVTNYLALRNAPAFDSANEIGAMYNGTEIQVINASGEYWYVYVPSLGMEGYVNGSYLSTSKPSSNSSSSNSGSNSSSGSKKNVYYASVEKNYLALRNAKAFDSANEIGKINNGEKVEVLDSSTGTYWYVYVPSLGMKGYVNSNFLTK